MGRFLISPQLLKIVLESNGTLPRDFVRISEGFFNVNVYKSRIWISLESFFLDANVRRFGFATWRLILLPSCVRRKRSVVPTFISSALVLECGKLARGSHSGSWKWLLRF